jgi:hypothetical protein
MNVDHMKPQIKYIIEDTSKEYILQINDLTFTFSNLKHNLNSCLNRYRYHYGNNISPLELEEVMKSIKEFMIHVTGSMARKSH